MFGAIRSTVNRAQLPTLWVYLRYSQHWHQFVSHHGPVEVLCCSGFIRFVVLRQFGFDIIGCPKIRNPRLYKPRHVKKLVQDASVLCPGSKVVEGMAPRRLIPIMLPLLATRSNGLALRLLGTSWHLVWSFQKQKICENPNQSPRKVVAPLPSREPSGKCTNQ